MLEGKLITLGSERVKAQVQHLVNEGAVVAINQLQRDIK